MNSSMDIFESMFIFSIEEGIASARKKYVSTGELNKRIFYNFVEGDPSKSKKYVEWMSKIAITSNWAEEEIIRVVKDFDRLANKGFLKNTNIYQYKTLEEVRDILEQLKSKEALKLIKKERERSVQTLINTSKFLVISPRTEEAMQKYGRGTRWCVTNPTDFVEYVKYEDTKIYIVIDKKGTFGYPGEKFAVSVDDQKDLLVWNEKDKWLSGGIPSSLSDKRSKDNFFSWLGMKDEEEAVKKLFKPFTKSEKEELLLSLVY